MNPTDRCVLIDRIVIRIEAGPATTDAQGERMLDKIDSQRLKARAAARVQEWLDAHKVFLGALAVAED